MHGMIQNMQPNRDRMRAAASEGYATATDLADYLVTRGVPFREAHARVGQIVRHCLENNRTLESLSLTELKAFHADLDEDVLDILKPEGSVASRNHIGGTAPDQVRLAIREARQRLG